MTTDLEILHEDLKQFCVDNPQDKNPTPGFAIHKRLILDLFKKSLLSLKKIKFADSVFSPQPLIKNHTTGFDLEFNDTNLSLELIDNGLSKLEVHLKNLTLSLKISIDGKLVSTTDFSYNDVFGYFTLIGQKLKLIQQRNIPVNTTTTFSNDRTAILTNAGITTPEDIQKFEIREQAVILIASDGLISAFIKGVDFPNFFEMLKGIKFDENGIVGFSKTKEHFFFSAIGELNLDQCPTKKSSGEVKVKKTNVTTDPDGKIVVSVETEQNPKYDNQWDTLLGSLEHTSTSENDLYIYVPKKTLTIPFNSILRPAVNLSDDGNFALIYWYWTSTAVINKVDITVSAAGGIPTVLLDVPVSINGQAGAGIEIACIKYEIAGAKWTGQIDPLQVEFTMAIDFASSSIVFVSRLKDVKGRDFSFDVNSPMGFPLDNIVGFILSEAAESIITSQAGKVLSTTRITLADFSLFREFNRLANNFAYHQDNDCNLTAGIKFIR